MNELIFEKNGSEIRVIKDESGEPLFCLSDICKNLEIQNHTDIKNSILREFEGARLNLYPFETNGGVQNFTMITEPQLYFMLMRSDKPKAKEFRQWVINEVLPSIRKSGSYSVRESLNPSLIDRLLQAKDEVIRAKEETIKAKEEIIKSKDDFIILQKEILQKNDKSVLDNIDIKEIKSKIKDNKNCKLSPLMREKYKELRFFIKVLASIPQANITQKMVWSYLYKVLIKEFNYKKNISAQVIKENKEFLLLLHKKSNELLQKAQEISIREGENIKPSNYEVIFNLD